MIGRSQLASYFIGWDVGGWNCDKNPKNRDAIVILDAHLSLVGKWRGNLRCPINQVANTGDWIRKLFSLCVVDEPTEAVQVTLAIDTPLGFPQAFLRLATEMKFVGRVERSDGNPYLFRHTERYLFEHGLKPLSAIKDMIGSQATKGMHVLAKFAPTVKTCGVWGDGESLTAIETYPSACKGSKSMAALRGAVASLPSDDGDDERDALTCALVAYLFAQRPGQLLGPSGDVATSEGWIWVPRDILQKTQP